jgi:predicted small lipoprotein YifL
MKNNSFALLLLGTLLVGCGQVGPLYLPTDKPPVYVEPESGSEDAEVKDIDKKVPVSVPSTQQEIQQKQKVIIKPDVPAEPVLPSQPVINQPTK